MKLLKIKQSLLLFITILLFSCENKQYETKIFDDSSFNIKEGRLVFHKSTDFSLLFNQLKQDSFLFNDFQTTLSKNGFYNSVKNIRNEQEENQLVTDNVFASMLNDRLEIEVEGTVFKVTPYGTFAFLPEKQERVYELIDSIDYGYSCGESIISEYFFLVEDGILRYDTFGEVRDNTVDIHYDLNNSPFVGNLYEDIQTYYIEKRHTIVGSFLQNTFGYSKTVNREFSSNRRIKVSFSCPNYLLLTYISASITFQKKNWIGWSKTECERLVFGWDGLITTLNVPVSFPNPYTFQMGNPNWTSAQLKPHFSPNTYLTICIPEFQIVYLNDKWNFKFGYNYSFTDKDIHKVFKHGFDWLKNNYGTMGQVSVMPTPNIIYFGPEERQRTNAGHMDQTFDWAVGASFTWDMSSPIGFQNFGTSPLSFNIKQASIYGKAFCDNRWLGVRISKDW